MRGARTKQNRILLHIYINGVNASPDDRALPGAPGVGSHATGERSLADQWRSFVHLACLLRLRLIGPCLLVPRGHAALALRLPLVCLHTALHAGAVVAARTPLASAALYCLPPPTPTHAHAMMSLLWMCVLPLVACTAWQGGADRLRARRRPRARGHRG